MLAQPLLFYIERFDLSYEKCNSLNVLSFGYFSS
jgi:hypothetical protein